MRHTLSIACFLDSEDIVYGPQPAYDCHPFWRRLTSTLVYCACVCVSGGTYVCEGYKCACAYGGQRSHSHPHEFFILVCCCCCYCFVLFLLKQGLSLFWNSPVRSGWMVTGPQGCMVFHLSSAGVTYTPTHSTAAHFF